MRRGESLKSAAAEAPCLWPVLPFGRTVHAAVADLEGLSSFHLFAFRKCRATVIWLTS
jgi:hypothetical protein